MSNPLLMNGGIFFCRGLLGDFGVEAGIEPLPVPSVSVGGLGEDMVGNPDLLHGLRPKRFDQQVLDFQEDLLFHHLVDGIEPGQDDPRDLAVFVPPLDIRFPGAGGQSSLQFPDERVLIGAGHQVFHVQQEQHEGAAGALRPLPLEVQHAVEAVLRVEVAAPGEETDHLPEGVSAGFVAGRTLKFRNGHGMLLSAVKFVTSRPWLAYLDIGLPTLPKRNNFGFQNGWGPALPLELF